MFGHYAGCASILGLHISDLDALDDFGAHGTRTLRQRLRNIHGICLTILIKIYPAHNIFGLKPRIFCQNISRRDLFNFHIKGTGHSGPAAQFFHPRLSQSHRDRAILLKACGNAGFSF